VQHDRVFLKCVLCNTRSLLNKLDYLKLLLQSCSVDVMLVMESWLDNSIPDSMIISQSDFNCYRKDRDRNGGGVCILVNSSINVIPVTLPKKFCHLEIVAIDVIGCDLKNRIIAVYRPPHNDQSAQQYINDTVACLRVLTEVNHPCIIAGDFNLPGIDWNFLSGSNSCLCAPFIDFVQDAGLYQFVTSATRGEHILDIVLSNDPFLVSDCWIDIPFGFDSPHSKPSDHNTVHFSIHCGLSTSSDAPGDFVYRDYAHADYIGLNNYLSSVDWQALLVNSYDINMYWNNFVYAIDSAVAMFVPLKYTKSLSIKQRRKYPYFIRQLFRKRHAAWRLYHRFGSAQVQNKYLMLDKKCKQAVYNFETEVEQNLIDSGDSGRFYRYVNNKIVSRTGIGVLKSEHGDLLHDDLDKAECFNTFFSSVFTHDNGIIPPIHRKEKKGCFTDVTFTYDDVFKVIVNLKSKYSTGPDGFSSIFLKNLAPSISFPLMLIFDQSFQSGTIPDIWKTATITPVFKKGCSCVVSNYRPISLTCICCKIMESIMKQKMLDYLLQYDLISRQQHGFLSRHSTCTQLLECVNDWTMAINNSYNVDVAYIDFSKAFDSVCHSKLIHKLESFGFGGKLLAWIKCYLSNRSQRVKVGNSFSSFTSVQSGVPQGSVLGPLFFLLYINDLVDVFGDFLSAKLFADDVKVYVVIDDDAKVNILQDGLDMLKGWSDMWQLDLSLHKCLVLHIGNDDNVCQSYNVDGIKLSSKNETVDLGIIMDGKLRFDKHILSMVNKAHAKAALIRRCFRSRDQNLLFRAFTVFVRPMLEYCSSVWNPHYRCDIDKIESVQRRFSKYVCSLSSVTYAERLNILHADSLELRRLKADLVMMYCSMHGLNALKFSDFFTLCNSNTRGHSVKLRKNFSRVNCRAFSFANRCIDVWNNLENDIVTAPSLYSFKVRLKSVDFSKFVSVV